MATIGFDTHEAVKVLTQAGFSETQAETVVSTVREAIGSDLAIKSDLENGLQMVKSELLAEIQSLEPRMTLRLGGFMIAVGGLIVAIIKLLPSQRLLAASAPNSLAMQDS